MYKLKHNIIKISNTRLLQNSNLKQKVKKMTIQKFGKTLFIYSCALIAVACSKNEQPATATNAILSPAFEVAFSTITNIPDSTVGGNPSTLTQGVVTTAVNVAKQGIVKDGTKVTLDLELSHTFCGDVVVELIAPSGESIALIKRLKSSVGDSSANFVQGNIFSFNGMNTNSINTEILSDSSPVLGGNYKPTFGLNPTPQSIVQKDLTQFFKDKNCNGDWSLRVSDWNGDDSGKIYSWKLKFAEGAL